MGWNISKPNKNPAPAEQKIPDLLYRISGIETWLILAICCLVLIGWQYNIEEFKRVVLSYSAMNPLTAICFIALAVGLLAVRKRPTARLRRIEMVLLSTSVTLVGAAIALRYITRIHFYLADRILFYPKLDVPGQIPNFMAPNTALGFIIIGLSLLLIDSRTKLGRRLSQYLAGTVSFLALIALLGYLYGNRQLLAYKAFIPISLHSAICFMLLSTAILLARPREGLMSLFSSNGGAGFMMRRLLVPAVFLPTILGWLRIQGEKTHLYSTEIGVALVIATNIMIGCILVWIAGYVLNKKEQEIDRSKDEFLNLATHQLRTPVTSVKMALSMLDDGTVGEISEAQSKLVKEALSASDREIRIVNDLLNVARADSGRMILKKEPTDLGKLVKNIVEEQLPLINSRHQRIELETPPLQAMVDPERLSMAIQNLVNNASKYTADGGSIKISVKKSGNMALIQTIDNGVGIPPEDISKIFVKFTRLDNALSKDRGGTGLGAYLIKKIVELHDGKLSVSSELGQGSIFTIELPMGR